MTRYMQAVLAALRFSSPDSELLSQLEPHEWNDALRFSDRAQLTLPIALKGREQAPAQIRARFDKNLCDNAKRWQRIKTAYEEIAGPFDRAGLDFAVLKGFSHCPCFIRDPRWRPQYDIDLLLPESQSCLARDVALSLGYEPIRRPSGRVDHLPTMTRKTGWQWRGDYFDPEIPLALEIHFRFWDEETEGFAPSGLDDFWDRRECRTIEGIPYVGLNPVDELGYACLHLLRHLLRGSLKLFHVYELASFLDHTSNAGAVWAEWRAWHDPSLRRLEGICFALAYQWFDCRLSNAASEEIESLPEEVVRWLDLFAFSPVSALAKPNKDELWLHWSLIESPRARWSMLRRRMIPALPEGPVAKVHVPDREITWRVRIERKWSYLRFSATRLAHHAMALPGVGIGAARWFGGLARSYWTFFFTAAFYNFGLFIFFLLYNLYLLQLGFREDFLGMVSGVMTAGSVAGCIPAAAAIRRFGMKRPLAAMFGIMACVSAVRAIVSPAPALIGLAFVAGFAGAFWGVAISPIVAQLTNERNRSLGFSLIMASGVGIGVVAGFIGGRLPGQLHSVLGSNIGGYRAALLCGCAMVLLGLLPLSRLKLETTPFKGPAFIRPSPALLKLFGAIVIWNVGTGIFNPFFSAFFVHLRFPTERIGELFSSVHLVQALAMLAGPIAFRRLGLARSLSAMQLATTLALTALATGKGAPIAYGAYMVFQYASEPGVFALLMNSVTAAERAGASALNMIVIFGAQALVAAAAGVLITRFGYPPVLAGAAMFCAASALVFRGLGDARSAPSDS